jgi:hypothetical protein
MHPRSQRCEGAGLRRRCFRHEPKDRRFDNTEDQQYDVDELLRCRCECNESASTQSAGRESRESREAVEDRRTFLDSIEDCCGQGRDRQSGREALDGTRYDERRRRAGSHEQDHGQDIQCQGSQDHRTAPNVIRERSDPEKRQKKKQDIRCEDDRDHKLRETEVLLIFMIERSGRCAACGKGDGSHNCRGRRDVARQCARRR